MNSSRSPSNISRHNGCSVTGALSVSAFMKDAVSIVHGPGGCAHQATSLFFSAMLVNERFDIPEIDSSCLLENEIIFGGEDKLKNTIKEAISYDPSAVFVIGTCISETIGDDIGSICAEEWGVPVINLKTSGFLGNTFESGFSNALMGVAGLIIPCGEKTLSANIIGEKNLEFEVEENFSEMKRLLGILGVDLNLRFVRDITVGDIKKFERASLNIFRDDSTGELSSFFEEKTGIPSIRKFPSGTAETVKFLKEAAEILGLPYEEAIRKEKEYQALVFEEFSDLGGKTVTFDSFGFQDAELPFFTEIALNAGIRVDPEGTVIPVPFTAPIGTTGIRRLLMEWRRFIDE